MATTMDSNDLPPGDAIEVLQESLQSLATVEVAHPDEDRGHAVHYKARLSTLGKVLVFTGASSPLTLTRSPRATRDDVEPQIFIGLQYSGAGTVVQNDREARVRQGEFAIYDSSSPYVLSFEHGIHQHLFGIPRAALALPESTITQLTAVAMGADTPIEGFVAAYLARLANSDSLQDGDQSATVAEPTIELVRAALSTRLADTANARPALEATLELRIVDYMTRHLTEPDLSAQRIAFAHHISVRYLYVVLARAGIAPGDWIRSRKLDGCRHELALFTSRNRTIGAIASAWGFTNKSRFSRLFKAAYGLSPREWRDIQK